MSSEIYVTTDLPKKKGGRPICLTEEGEQKPLACKRLFLAARWRQDVKRYQFAAFLTAKGRRQMLAEQIDTLQKPWKPVTRRWAQVQIASNLMRLKRELTEISLWIADEKAYFRMLAGFKETFDLLRKARER